MGKPRTHTEQPLLLDTFDKAKNGAVAYNTFLVKYIDGSER